MEQQRTIAQLNSHMAMAGNRTGVTLVRGEPFTYKPTVSPNDYVLAVNYYPQENGENLSVHGFSLIGDCLLVLLETKDHKPLVKK